MDKILERINEFANKDARYAYADAVTNAFLTAQIKALRDERGLTQEQLADLVGTQQSGISRWQHSGYSNCKVETLRKFAKAFGVRLRITFEDFGSLPTDVRGFTKKRLTPLRFEEDPVFREQPNAEQNGIAATVPTNAIAQFANAKAGEIQPVSLPNEMFFGDSGIPLGATLKDLASSYLPRHDSSVDSVGNTGQLTWMLISGSSIKRYV